MSKASDLKDMCEENMDDLFDWIKELSKSKVTNVKQILTWTTPKEWEKIEKAIIKHYKDGRIKSSEDVEAFVSQNYTASDYNK